MLSKKRRRVDPPTIHPQNRYSENPPDFALLGSLYPSFQSFLLPSRRPGGRPTIDWSDFNATRELTRVLLLHDHGVHWWIPDGQLCPTVPNRSNYIHWLQDLLSSDVVPPFQSSEEKVRGFDIGTGANCIYPLLGASLLGWSFVGSDVTKIALEWARKNVQSNPHLSELIEIRNACDPSSSGNVENDVIREEAPEGSTHNPNMWSGCCSELPVLVGVIKDGEKFDFCMCNPPFFESVEEAGLNPRTSCGGTFEEMVFPGGERAFITHIIDDSLQLKHSFRWFTSMVGRKANLKFLVSKLHEVGVSVVKSTEFVQGHTARWGLAWSFLTPAKKFIALQTPKRSHNSFMLEGLQRQVGAFQVLKSVESFFLAAGASCKSDLSSFCVNVTLSEHTGELHKNDSDTNEISSSPSIDSNNFQHPLKGLSFRISVFQQVPGTLLVRASSLDKESSSGSFFLFFQQLEDALKAQFLKPNSKN
ncbi:putative 23S rRNA (adenine(1618)-N(6))-methyltransferase [Dioscorea sansibarensis]